MDYDNIEDIITDGNNDLDKSYSIIDNFIKSNNKDNETFDFSEPSNDKKKIGTIIILLFILLFGSDFLLKRIVTDNYISISRILILCLIVILTYFIFFNN